LSKQFATSANHRFEFHKSRSSAFHPLELESVTVFCNGIASFRNLRAEGPLDLVKLLELVISGGPWS
jgi:hypothetical protein